MTEKCPYCYRNIGTWHKDPIKLPEGSSLIWSTDTELIVESDITKRLYKGIDQICELEIQEIQDALKDLEENNILLANRTIFSPLNISGKFQITGKHILEMRQSVEKLLTALVLTKTTYFNYDENGNHIITPNGDKLDWTDPITESTDLEKFQVKYIHIEDLRHMIESLWVETWEKARIVGTDPLSVLSDSVSVSRPTGAYSSYFSGKHLYADKDWGTGAIGLRLGAEFSATHAVGSGLASWIVSGTTNKIFNFSAILSGIHGDLNGLNAWGIVEGSGGDNRVIFTQPNLACNPNLFFEIDTFTANISASCGTHVIIENPYYYYGWHDSDEQLNAQEAANKYAVVEIRLVFLLQNVYISYYILYSSAGIPTWGLAWTGASRSLYADAQSLFGYISPTDFTNWWTVNAIELRASGYVSSIWAGYTDPLREVKAYTTNAYMNIDVILDNLRFVNH